MNGSRRCEEAAAQGCLDGRSVPPGLFRGGLACTPPNRRFHPESHSSGQEGVKQELFCAGPTSSLMKWLFLRKSCLCQIKPEILELFPLSVNPRGRVENEEFSLE